MGCNKCDRNNFIVVSEQISGDKRYNVIDFLYDVGKLSLILCTLGLWLLVGERRGSSNTNFRYKTARLCQSCGHRQEA